MCVCVCVCLTYHIPRESDVLLQVGTVCVCVCSFDIDNKNIKTLGSLEGVLDFLVVEGVDDDL